MLIFGNDDNDDNLDWDGEKSKTPPAPSSSSLPTRPTTKGPFGSDPDQTGNVANKQDLPARKPLPPSPFGQGGKPRLPQNTPAAKKDNSPVSEPDEGRKAPLPFSRPVDNTSKVSPAVPSVPNLSSYLPPSKKAQPAVQPDAEVEQESEEPSQSEILLRAMQEQAAERAEAAKREQEAKKLQATPVVVPEEPLASSNEAAVPPSEPETKKKKKGFFAPPPKKDTKNASAKPVREKKYEGERKKILYIRLISGAVASIVAIAGLQAIFLPESGPSKAQVQSAAKEAVNYTGFPTMSGEQFALDFSMAYFNYDSKDTTARTKSLEKFANKELIRQIDIAILSPQEYESVKKDGISYSNYSVTQSITYGPYVVATNNITDKHAVFTVKVGLKEGKVVYLDVPVKYDPENYSLTLAGPPSFTKPIQNAGTAEKKEWTLTFEGGEDDVVEKEEQDDIKEYLIAWAASNQTNIERYIISSATDNAKKGLQESVIFKDIIDLKIEPFSEDIPKTAHTRRVELNVMWEDASTGLRYPQQYRMLITKNQDDKWAVYDIENFAVLNK